MAKKSINLPPPTVVDVEPAPVSNYERAMEISKKSKLASCYEWMKQLLISYTEAVTIMDRMEEEKWVDPPKEKETGPREFKQR
jgi:hypothetical protein